MQVTARNINSLPPGTHYLDRCLYLRKREGRRPTWVFRYAIAGKRKDCDIGPVDSITIPQAKEIAARYRAMIADGIDPIAAKRERRERMKATEETTKPLMFEALIDEALPVIERSKAWKNAKHRAQWETTLRTYALPVLGKMTVEDITRDDVLKVLLPIWKDKAETAQRLRGRLESVFSYAIATGKRVASNPATWRGNLDMFLPQMPKSRRVEHHEALTFEEARALFEEWRPPKSATACAVVFGALTCSRVGEFILAKWDEIDLEEKLWTCPPERRKDGKPYPHRVPLSEQALYILSLLPKRSPYIFTGPSGAHLSKETPRIVIRRKLGHGTMHGFRSTFRDWCAENGKDPVVAEKSLMHATGDAVVQAYQRSDLLDARRVLLQEWADAVYPMPE